jgi:hypothetical protein
MDTFVQRPFCSCAVSRRGRCTLTVCPRRGRALNETFRHFRSLLANNGFASRSERGWARRVNVAHAASVLCRPAAVEWLVAMMAFPASPSATVAAMGGKRYRAGQGRLLVGGYGTVRRAGFEALWQSVGGVGGGEGVVEKRKGLNGGDQRLATERLSIPLNSIVSPLHRVVRRRHLVKDWYTCNASDRPKNVQPANLPNRAKRR